MTIHDYHTNGGKNMIKTYLDALPKDERVEGYRIRQNIANDGMDALSFVKTRQLRGKLWEIKFSANRIMYIVADRDNIYFLHICKKEKGKTEMHDIDTAIRRAKECGLM